MCRVAVTLVVADLLTAELRSSRNAELLEPRRHRREQQRERAPAAGPAEPRRAQEPAPAERPPAAALHVAKVGLQHPPAARLGLRVTIGDMRTAEELVAFARRDRERVQREKERYWVEWRRAHGSAEASALAERLRVQARKARPDWPSEAERMDDLRVHVRVSELLRRVPVRGR